MVGSKKIARGFAILRGDQVEVFCLGKEILNQMTRPINMPTERRGSPWFALAGAPPRCPRRPAAQLAHALISVECLVGDQPGGDVTSGR